MATQWREKYLVALEEQERLEKQVAAHADMLRRTVMHLSAASDGLDKSLDTELSLFKEKLRGASGLSVNEQLTRVEQAVKKWHSERATQTRTTCELLKTFANEFKSLRLDNNTQQNIKHFKSTLSPQNVELYKQFDWLKNLLTLHTQAITAAALPDQNLWQRLRTGKRLVSYEQNPNQNHDQSQNQPNDPNTAITTNLHDNASTNNAVQDDKEAKANKEANTHHTANTSHETKAIEQSNNAAKANTENQTTEVNSSVIELNHSAETEQLLHDIFSAIVPSEELNQSIVNERQRIDEGVNGQNINTFLRAIRDILQASYMNYGAEFSHYLEHMNSELTRICQAMDSHLENATRQMIAREKDTQTLEQSQGKLAQAKQKTDTNELKIDDLKDAVMEHLSVIEKSLAQRKTEQNACEQNNNNLQQVVQTLHTVEDEAKTTQGLMEKEQHQANRDALTNLPNRTGCSLRIGQEHDRFKRYFHPVTLAICNIDGLAIFNEYGYIIGDRVLKLVATTLRERLRSVDFIGRYHGDKFLLIQPEITPAQSKITLEKISQFLAKTPLTIKGKPVQVTLSFSLTSFKKDEDNSQCYHRMMGAFSEIKKAGGNSIHIND